MIAMVERAQATAPTLTLSTHAVDYRRLLKKYMAAVFSDDCFIAERCASQDGGNYTPQEAAVLGQLASEIGDEDGK
jgi:hypothetical protein